MVEISPRRLQNPALFVCDIQEKFRPVVWNYDSVISTAKKMLQAASILSIPVYATTQNRNRLGETCSELCLENAVEYADKTAFSMWTPAIRRHFREETPAQIAIVGIESHICITQTALDILASGHKVYILADGVSSRNREEIPVALSRLQKDGAVITTSESFLYECMGDSKIPEFKNIAKLVKEFEEDSKVAIRSLLGRL